MMERGEPAGCAGRVTIFCPTRNRPLFLHRQLHQYRAFGFDGEILFGDGSDPDQFEQMQRLFEAFPDLKINVVHEPGLSAIDVVERVSDRFTTPYVAYAGDDDLQVPATLTQAANWLDANEGYSGAGGARVNVSLGAPEPVGRIQAIRVPGTAEYDHPDPALRLFRYAATGLSTQFFLFRRETWLAMHDHARRFSDRYWGLEFLACSHSVIVGKIRQLNLPGVFMQDDRQGALWDREPLIDKLVSRDWSETAEAIWSVLAALLKEAGAGDDATCERLARHAMYTHLALLVPHHHSLSMRELLTTHPVLADFTGERSRAKFNPDQASQRVLDRFGAFMAGYTGP